MNYLLFSFVVKAVSLIEVSIYDDVSCLCHRNLASSAVTLEAGGQTCEMVGVEISHLL